MLCRSVFLTRSRIVRRRVRPFVRGKGSGKGNGKGKGKGGLNYMRGQDNPQLGIQTRPVPDSKMLRNRVEALAGQTLSGPTEFPPHFLDT